MECGYIEFVYVRNSAMSQDLSWTHVLLGVLSCVDSTLIASSVDLYGK